MGQSLKKFHQIKTNSSFQNLTTMEVHIVINCVSFTVVSISARITNPEFSLEEMAGKEM